MPALKIDDRISVADFQKNFSSVFPFLKIEFFKPTAKVEDKSYKSNSFLSASEKIGNSTKKININNQTTVTELKKLLSDELGVLPLIYRKSGSMWIETSLTEDWSLERQNSEAEQMNK